MDAVAVLQALTGLLTLVGQASEAAIRITSVLQRAQLEGRDLTDDELNDAIAIREDAEQNLLAALDKMKQTQIV